MAEVKFIQIGENQKLYWDGKSNTGTYLATLNSVKEQYPGALIFTTYYKDTQHNTEEKHKKHELWANGKRYTLGGGLGELSLYTGTEDPWVYFSTDHTGAEIDIDPGTYYIKTRELNTTTHHYDPSPTNPENDDDYDRIVSDFTISEQELKSRSQSTGQNNNPIAEPNDVAKERTAYIYNPNEASEQTKSTKASWYALSGNVDASNVYFPEGVQRTIKFGVLQDKSGDDIVIDGVNKNLKDLLEGYLVKEVWPTVGKPTINKTPSTSYSVSHNAETPSSLTVTVNNETPSSDYILYGSTINASGSYDPTLKLNSDKPISVTYGPNKITGITWGYYKMAGDNLDENYPDAIKPVNKEISGASVTGYFDYDDSETTQECTSKIKYKKNGDQNYTNGTVQTTKTSETPTYTLSTLSPSLNNIPSTTLGSLKIGLENTNSSFWSRTAYTSKSGSGDNITYTAYPSQIPATETICLNSNKGNPQLESGNPKKTVHSAESISSPAVSASLSDSDKSATNFENTYNIYVKVWHDTPNNRQFQEKKVTSDNFNITWNPGYASSSLVPTQKGPLRFKVPVGFTVSAITLNGNPFTGNLTDFYVSEELDYNNEFNSGNSGKYIKYQLIKSKSWTFGAHSSDASAQLSISFTKSGSITEADIPQQNN